MLSKGITAKNYLWYKNPKYYLVGILVVWGVRFIVDISHSLFPSLVTIDGSTLNGALFVIFSASFALLLRKEWKNRSNFALFLVSGRPATLLCSMQNCFNPGICRLLLC